MALSMNQAINKYFIKNGRPLVGDEFKSAYKKLLVDALTNKVQLKFYGSDDTMKFFAEKQFRTLDSIDQYRATIEDQIRKEASSIMVRPHSVDKIIDDDRRMDLADDLTKITTSERNEVGLTIKDKMKILPELFTKEDKAVRAINEVYHGYSSFTEKEAKQAIKYATSKVSALKPSWFTRLFHKDQYATQMEVYKDAKEKLISVVSQSYNDKFLLSNYGNPPKLMGTKIDSISEDEKEQLVDAHLEDYLRLNDKAATSKENDRLFEAVMGEFGDSGIKEPEIDQERLQAKLSKSIDEDEKEIESQAEEKEEELSNEVSI